MSSTPNQEKHLNEEPLCHFWKHSLEPSILFTPHKSPAFIFWASLGLKTEKHNHPQPQNHPHGLPLKTTAVHGYSMHCSAWLQFNICTKLISHLSVFQVSTVHFDGVTHRPQQWCQWPLPAHLLDFTDLSSRSLHGHVYLCRYKTGHSHPVRQQSSI